MSFNLDLTGLTDIAANFFNSLSPVITIVGGIALGIGLVGWVIAILFKMFKNRF